MRNKGFTLIELLVVISIIAILATISITVFAGAQASARDGKRISEINSIAKSIESSKNYVTGMYTYNSTTFGDDFPKNAPADDNYCVGTKVNAVAPFTPPVPPATYPASGCPVMTGGTVVNGAFSTSYTSGGLSLGTATSWTVCAKLERTTVPYCVFSLTK